MTGAGFDLFRSLAYGPGCSRRGSSALRLKRKVAPPSISSADATHHQGLVAQVSSLEGSVQGGYTDLASPTGRFASVGPQCGGVVYSLKVVSHNGMMSAAASELTLRDVAKYVTETLVLHGRQVVENNAALRETFAYQSTEGLNRGTIIIDLHADSSPARSGTYDAELLGTAGDRT